VRAPDPIGGCHGVSLNLVEARPVALVAFDLSRLLEAFFAGRKERTIPAYRADLEDFRAFVGAATMGEASSRLLSGSHGVANAAAIAYKAHMMARRLQAATINRRLAALRSLVKLANTLGLVSWTLAVKNVQAQAYRDTRGPGLDAYKALLAVAQAHPGTKGLRDVAL
jgi:integrase/recombinase XerC